MDDIKIFAKIEEIRTQTIRLYNQNIGMDYGGKNWAMQVFKVEKKPQRNRIATLEKHQNAWSE